MRIIPDSVHTKIVELGQNVLDGDKTEVDIAEEGGIWLRDKEPRFALAVLTEWWRARTKSWLYTQQRGALGGGEAGGEQMPIPFPDLPTWLEVGIGRQVHQNGMKRKDWHNALAIYRNREEQASLALRSVERAWREVEPLFTDDEMTTADALARKAVAI
jgi:hypothetical protein